ncbi:MAG TPA: hypothetical protein VFJ91_00410 [Gaiellaceae bacterium]|jgi:hypothetical protein|nr:hypothetical protein [Gaiellaceae bacterium]
MVRVVRIVAGAFGALLGVWYRAVLAAPEVRRRKARRRALRRY